MRSCVDCVKRPDWRCASSRVWKKHAWFTWAFRAAFTWAKRRRCSLTAATALFHRKAFAGPKRPEFAALDRRSQKIVQTLSVLLRMAENLNRGHTNVVRHAYLRAVSSKKITLTVHAAGDCQLEIWGVQSNQAAFEKELGRAITIELAADRPQ